MISHDRILQSLHIQIALSNLAQRNHRVFLLLDQTIALHRRLDPARQLTSALRAAHHQAKAIRYRSDTIFYRHTRHNTTSLTKP